MLLFNVAVGPASFMEVWWSLSCEYEAVFQLCVAGGLFELCVAGGLFELCVAGGI